MPPARSFTLISALTTAAGLALLVWLVWTAGPRDVWRGIQQVGWGLAAIVVIAGARFALRASAWRRCLEPPHRLRLPDAIAAVISGDALGNATPLGPLVGEPAKAAFVRTKVPLGAAFTALAVENLFYTLSVAAMIAAGTLALLLRGGLAGNVRLAAELAIGAILAAYLVAGWALVRRPALLSTALRAAAAALRSDRLQQRMSKVRRLEEDVYSFAARRGRAAGAVVLTELAFHALGVLEVHLTLWLLLGAPPPLVTSFVLETVNRLTTVLFKFVPQQVGVNEGGTVLAAQVLGLGFQTASTLAIVRRARMVFWQLAGMILLVRHGISTRRILADEELRSRSVHQGATRSVPRTPHS